MTVDAGRFRRAKEVFLAASRREGADRERYLAETCGDDADLRADVERLLDADGRPSRLLDADAVPERIGEFRILGRLGAGGMGTVYEAEQQSPRRRVALKVLAPFLAGEEARRRFGYEAEILGRLEHPGIARVFAAGVEEGRPWFAMELVDGEPVTRYVRTRRLGARERLELVVRVCAAVQHAHQKGVVHRDLKPANILVDRDGQPKLLDFGVAKLTDAETRVTSLATRTGQLLGTIPYMSPEQVSVDAARIDLRTDVYALGVLAFELLSGRHPLDMEGKLLAQAILAVRDEEPPRLGTLDGTWRGDIETVVGKAMSKDRERRYASAGEFAADIERHLRDEPVVARPPTTGYQLRKFARRNRVLVGGIVAVFAVLVTGIVVSMGYSLEAAAERAAAVEAGERERERAAEATRRTATASAALDFMVDLFEAGHPDARGGPALTTREMVERGAERVETRLRDQPELRSTLLYRIGRIFFALGEHERARAMYEGALAAAAESDAGDPEIPVAVRCHLAAMLEGQRRHDEAAPLRQEALAIARTGVAGAAALAGALRGMADHLVWRNRLAEAEALFREVLAHEAERLADAAPVLIGAHLGLARVMRRTRRLDEALRHGEKAVSLARRLHGDQHPQVAIALTPQAHTLAEAGRHADAVRLLREVRGMRLLWGGEDSAGIGEIDYYLGEALRKLGETGEALACHRRSFAIAQRTFKPDDPRLLIALSGLLEARLAAGDLDGLEAAAAKLVERQYALVGPAARRTGMYVLLLGRAVLAGQEPERAAPVFAKAATLLADTVGPHSQQAVAARVMRTRALIAAGAWTEALSAAREAMAGQEDAETREAAHAAYDLGRVLRETDDGGEPAEAETLLRRALELYRRHGAAADARRAEQLLAAPVK